jgi:hypothetical protein
MEFFMKNIRLASLIALLPGIAIPMEKAHVWYKVREEMQEEIDWRNGRKEAEKALEEAEKSRKELAERRIEPTLEEMAEEYFKGQKQEIAIEAQKRRKEFEIKLHSPNYLPLFVLFNVSQSSEQVKRAANLIKASAELNVIISGWPPSLRQKFEAHIKEQEQKIAKEMQERLLELVKNRHDPSYLLNLALFNLRQSKEISAENFKKIADLIQAGADLNATVIPSGIPSLFCVIDIGDEDIIKLLLDNGAAVNQKLNNQTPLMYYFTKQTFNYTPWHIYFGPRPKIAIVRLLMQYGADVNKKSMSKWGERTALMQAALSGEPEIVQLLIEGIPVVPPALKTVCALRSSYLSILPKELLEITAQYINRADPNIQDKDGKTALNYAITTLETIVGRPGGYENVDQLIKRYKEVINILEPITAKR